jgi:putative acetyltransferase
MPPSRLVNVSTVVKSLPPDVQLRPVTNADCGAVTELIVGILGAYELSPDHTTTDRDMADLEGYYEKSGGCFDVLVDRKSARIVGTVGLRPMDRTTVELRKMYLHPDFRGRELGRFLLDHALAEAKRRGFTRVFLETATVLREALNLYRSAGFQPCKREHACAKRCDMTMELTI